MNADGRPRQALLVAEQRRLEHLAAEVRPPRWIVVVGDEGSEVAVAAARACRDAPVLSISEGSPIPAMQRLAQEGLRHRVYLWGGPPEVVASRWSGQLVGLLSLPAAHPALRAILAAWARYLPVGGHVLFFGGLAPHPRTLGLSEPYWTPHLRGEGLFLLTRRPHG